MLPFYVTMRTYCTIHKLDGLVRLEYLLIPYITNDDMKLLRANLAEKESGL